MKTYRILFSLLVFIVSILSCSKVALETELEQRALVSKYEDNWGPIIVQEIVYGNWKGANHAQGFSFSANSVIVSCTKQLIKYDPVLDQVIAERKCTDLPNAACNSFHYGDPASDKGHLWVPYSNANKWDTNVNCYSNQILLFPEAQIDNAHSPLRYPVDYPGHIGALEIIDDKIYVSGRNIGQGWPYDDNCHTELLIYVYNIENLSEKQCNSHDDAIILKANGKNGIQSLSKLDKDHLLITAYKCEDDPDDYVRLLNVNNEKITLFQNENWAYGVAIHDNGLLYFCEDNRNSKKIFIRGIKMN